MMFDIKFILKKIYILCIQQNLSNRPPPQIDYSPVSITSFGSQTIVHTFHCNDILPKPTTSLNSPFKVDPMTGRFREVLLYTVKPL